MNASGDEIVETIKRVTGVVEQNSAAAEQMSASSTEVTTSVDGIATISGENSAAIQDVSASAEQLTAQMQEVVSSSQRLEEMSQGPSMVVGSFDLGGDGTNGMQSAGLVTTVTKNTESSDANETQPKDD